MSKWSRIIVIVNASVLFGCSGHRQFGCASTERLPESYLNYEKQVDAVYSTGSVQIVETKLLALLSTIDEYQVKYPHIFQFYWNRGVVQGRLSLVYRHVGRDFKADELMSQSIASFKRLSQHKLKEENIMIHESWVKELLDIVDEPLDPAWKKKQGNIRVTLENGVSNTNQESMPDADDGAEGEKTTD